MPFKQSFVEINQCRISMLRGGTGEMLLYLHGANGAGAVQPFMTKLAERFDVIVPEHPGFGLSDEPNWLENIHDLAYFYLDFLRTMGQSDRDFVENANPNPAIPQALALMNGERISPRGLLSPYSPVMHGVERAADKVDAAFLALLSRAPTPAERARLAGAAPADLQRCGSAQNNLPRLRLRHYCERRGASLHSRRGGRHGSGRVAGLNRVDTSPAAA